VGKECSEEREPPGMHLFPPVTAKCSSYCGDRSFSILQVRCGMQRPLETVLAQSRGQHSWAHINLPI
jgi:hypothetical protein